jgi:hypothetical protein
MLASRFFYIFQVLMGHGHLGCIKKFPKSHRLKLPSTFIADKQEDLSCKTHDLQHYAGHMYDQISRILQTH